MPCTVYRSINEINNSLCRWWEGAANAESYNVVKDYKNRKVIQPCRASAEQHK